MNGLKSQMRKPVRLYQFQFQNYLKWPGSGGGENKFMQVLNFLDMTGISPTLRTHNSPAPIHRSESINFFLPLYNTITTADTTEFIQTWFNNRTQE